MLAYQPSSRTVLVSGKYWSTSVWSRNHRSLRAARSGSMAMSQGSITAQRDLQGRVHGLRAVRPRYNLFDRGRRRLNPRSLQCPLLKPPTLARA